MFELFDGLHGRNKNFIFSDIVNFIFHEIIILKYCANFDVANIFMDTSKMY